MLVKLQISGLILGEEKKLTTCSSLKLCTPTPPQAQSTRIRHACNRREPNYPVYPDDFLSYGAMIARAPVTGSVVAPSCDEACRMPWTVCGTASSQLSSWADNSEPDALYQEPAWLASLVVIVLEVVDADHTVDVESRAWGSGVVQRGTRLQPHRFKQ